MNLCFLMPGKIFSLSLFFFSGKNKTKENVTIESTDNLSNSMKTDEIRKEGKFKDLVKGCNLKVS